jgi:hypothetical protein
MVFSHLSTAVPLVLWQRCGFRFGHSFGFDSGLVLTLVVAQVTYFDFAPRINTVVFCRSGSIGELSFLPSPKVGPGTPISIILR